eukprot:scaffold270781_cov31-Tisochrysis_lutea.AAC.2
MGFPAEEKMSKWRRCLRHDGALGSSSSYCLCAAAEGSAISAPLARALLRSRARLVNHHSTLQGIEGEMGTSGRALALAHHHESRAGESNALKRHS